MENEHLADWAWKYCTDAEKEAYQTGSLREYDVTDEDQAKWFALSIVAFKIEVACIEHHLDEVRAGENEASEMEDVLWHLHNLAQGLPAAMAAVLQLFIPQGERNRVGAELLAAKMSMQTGRPMRAVEIGPGSWAVGEDKFTVPDTAEEILKEWGE